jgi:hypothetical protein
MKVVWNLLDHYPIVIALDNNFTTLILSDVDDILISYHCASSEKLITISFHHEVSIDSIPISDYLIGILIVDDIALPDDT